MFGTGLQTPRFRQGSFAEYVAVPTNIIFPIVVVSLFGAYAYRTNALDMFVMMVIGLLGYWAIRSDMGVVPLVFGMVLGPIFEVTFMQTRQIARGDYVSIVTRPGVIGFLVFVAAAMIAIRLVKERQRFAA